MTVFINQQVVHEQTLTEDIGLIGGAQFSFEGIGEVQGLEFREDLELINLSNHRPKSALSPPLNDSD